MKAENDSLKAEDSSVFFCFAQETLFQRQRMDTTRQKNRPPVLAMKKLRRAPEFFVLNYSSSEGLLSRRFIVGNSVVDDKPL